jgi:hypothetical protein
VGRVPGLLKPVRQLSGAEQDADHVPLAPRYFGAGWGLFGRDLVVFGLVEVEEDQSTDLSPGFDRLRSAL